MNEWIPTEYESVNSQVTVLFLAGLVSQIELLVTIPIPLHVWSASQTCFIWHGLIDREPSHGVPFTETV